MKCESDDMIPTCTGESASKAGAPPCEQPASTLGRNFCLYFADNFAALLASIHRLRV